MTKWAKRLLLLLTLGGGFYYFGWRNDRVRASVREFVFPTATVVDPGFVRLNGVVTARDVVVSAKVAGRIEKLDLDEGSIVRKDDVVVLLDSEESRSEISNQTAKIAQLEARLSQQLEVVDMENERLKNQLHRSASNVKAAENETERVSAELKQAQQDADRIRQLHGYGIIAKSELERALTAVQVAEAKLKSLKDQVSAARAEYELVETNGRQIKLASSDVVQTRAQIDQSRAQLEQVKTRLGYTDVHAPISGVVSLRVSTRGEVVKQGDPILTIVNLDDIWVKTNVEEGQMNLVRLGDQVPVELASGQRVTGEVIHVAPEAEFATQRDVSRTKRDIRAYGIKVRVPNADRRIHPGMTAYVLINSKPSAEPPRQSPTPVDQRPISEAPRVPGTPVAQLNGAPTPQAQAAKNTKKKKRRRRRKPKTVAPKPAETTVTGAAL